MLRTVKAHIEACHSLYCICMSSLLHQWNRPFFSFQPSIGWSVPKQLFAFESFFYFILFVPQCFSSASLHLSIQPSGRCLYALSGTDPPRPSVKRTEGLGPEPAGKGNSRTQAQKQKGGGQRSEDHAFSTIIVLLPVYICPGQTDWDRQGFGWKADLNLHLLSPQHGV